MVSKNRVSWIRERYWGIRKTGSRAARLAHRSNWSFGTVLARDAWNATLGRIRPVNGESRVRAQAAMEWLLRAQRATPDDGVSVGYFPTDPNVINGWLGSYPETTGYIMQSLLDYARLYQRPDIVEKVRFMAHWEIDIQMPSGAVQGGPVCPQERQSAAVFNTGMVLQGWTACLFLESDRDIEKAARKAADFLLADQGSDGNFRTHGPFVSEARVKTYNCLCAWALHRFADLTGSRRYADGAVRAVEAAIREQNQVGWFAHNCLTNPEAPITHTIGYTLQGILETGILAKREDFIQAAKFGTDAILARMNSDGYLPGRFDASWRSVGFSSCLTGSAQIAIVAYRLSAITGEAHYKVCADRLVDFLKGTQRLTGSDDGVRGALAGSFPVFGSYMSWGYPNWATKYLLDSLMLQDMAS